MGNSGGDGGGFKYCESTDDRERRSKTTCHQVIIEHAISQNEPHVIKGSVVLTLDFRW